MSLVLSSKGTSPDFQPHPVGMTIARCIRLIDLGTQESNYMGQRKKVAKVRLVFESATLMDEGEMAGKPFLVSNTYTASLHEKSTLRKNLESWRGRKFTAEELEGFDLKNILGKPCMLNLIHEEREGKQYANVSSISPLMASMTAPKAVNPLVYLSLDPEHFDENVFNSLSDKLKETIKKSPEYAAIYGKSYAEEEAKSAGAKQIPSGIDDDDIPFISSAFCHDERTSKQKRMGRYDY